MQEREARLSPRLVQEALDRTPHSQTTTGTRSNSTRMITMAMETKAALTLPLVVRLIRTSATDTTMTETMTPCGAPVRLADLPRLRTPITDPIPAMNGVETHRSWMVRVSMMISLRARVVRGSWRRRFDILTREQSEASIVVAVTWRHETASETGAITNGGDVCNVWQRTCWCHTELGQSLNFVRDDVGW